MKTILQLVLGVLLLANLFGCELDVSPVQPAAIASSDISKSPSVSQIRGSASFHETPAPPPECKALDITDEDHDGAAAEIDCNDHDPIVFPGAYEWCDYLDNDCNGQTDENWQQMFGSLIGETCIAIGQNGCSNAGIWGCDFSHDWITCNATPRNPEKEVCNGFDDDCNGITDTDAWPEIGLECTVEAEACVLSGVWECDSYSGLPYCTAENKVAAPGSCNQPENGD